MRLLELLDDVLDSIRGDYLVSKMNLIWITMELRETCDDGELTEDDINSCTEYFIEELNENTFSVEFENIKQELIERIKIEQIETIKDLKK